MLGFHRAGCRSTAGVEWDADAATSYALNFHAGDEQHAQSRDITKLHPLEFLAALGIAAPTKAVDLIIGGPPCPAFTRVGRAKLRKVHAHPQAHLRDPRAQLYLHYLEFVRALRPVALLMENVPDVLNFGGRNLGEEMSASLEDAGYVSQYTLLNAASYGVPQMRERFFLVAIHKEAEATFRFPEPTRAVTFPRGYESSRSVALKHVVQGDLGRPTHFVPTPTGRASLPAVTVKEAIGDLPFFKGDTMRRGAQRFDVELPYPDDTELSEHARLMRSWPGFPATGGVWDHVTRALSRRDFRLFAKMERGDDYPAAKRLARKLHAEAVESGECPDITDYVPPYNERTFPNRWRKIEPNAPSRTLMAHLGKDTYSHIHYDGRQARTISVREAARLQSFPDGFTFSGSMNPAFRQIGNAVPPLLAFHLARALLDGIGASVAERDLALTNTPKAAGM